MDEIRPEPIEQIRQRYEGEWLLIKVTSHDENGLPKEGILLGHFPDRKAAWDATEIIDGEVYVFFAGPTIPEGWEAVLHGWVSL
jgi:hypothetical protein